MSDSNDELSDLFGAIKKINEPKQVELADIMDTTFRLVPRGQGPFREKYRPQRINEIVPTCSIELLRNQISNPNGSQIFLLEGNSGVGKTSCARILARANICEATNALEKPCLTCEMCKQFDRSFDVTEMNAANQNKVEDIRNLVDNDMRYGPSLYKKKIYILDEVQRLTDAAQQVLLTELEEPHSYLLVFLCTTDIKEINKALVDRACRISFSKLTSAHARLIIQQVAKHEKLQIPEDLFENLFLQSKGSVRALLNNIQAFSQNGYNAQVWPEDETNVEVNTLYKLIIGGDWSALAKALSKPEIRKDPDSLRAGLENYVRAVMLNTPNLNDATKLGNVMMRIQGSTKMESPVIQYNDLVLKCLRACAAFKS